MVENYMQKRELRNYVKRLKMKINKKPKNFKLMVMKETLENFTQDQLKLPNK
jgi:hypothetical protein